MKIKIIEKLKEDKSYRSAFFLIVSLIFNLMFSLYNGILGFISLSAWFIFTAIYYILLSTMRIFIVFSKSIKSTINISGILLTVLSVVTALIIYISLKQNIASKYGEITMITIATYTFTKIIIAIISAAKKSKSKAAIQSTVRTIRYSEIAVSVVSMQRSMLVSFGDMLQKEIKIMNFFTGLCAFCFIFTLGIITLKRGIGYGKT